jgi:cytochrome P450
MDGASSCLESLSSDCPHHSKPWVLALTPPPSPRAPHPRRATADFELRGRRIPKGWRVFCHTGRGVLSYNRDTFDPSRWLGEQQAPTESGGEGKAGEGAEEEGAPGGCPFAAGGAPPGAGAGGSPFGAGPRACVGRPLVLAQLTALVALLARRYSWRTERGAAEPWDIVPAPRPSAGLGGFELTRLAEGDQIPVDF